MVTSGWGSPAPPFQLLDQTKLKTGLPCQACRANDLPAIAVTHRNSHNADEVVKMLVVGHRRHTLLLCQLLALASVVFRLGIPYCEHAVIIPRPIFRNNMLPARG